MQTLVDEYLDPIVRILFPKLMSKYEKYEILPKIMAYSNKNGVKDWHIHTDGDIVTLNICLTGNFNGAKLRVYHEDESNDDASNASDTSNTSNKSDNVAKFTDYQHNVAGNAIIHGGDVLHSVMPLTSGRRCSLIVKFNTLAHNY